MNDKKNFSVLGRIDPEYIEEAEAYSVPSKKKNEGDRVETKRRSARRSRNIKRAAGLAAAAVVFCGVCVAVQLSGAFSARKEAFGGESDNAYASEAAGTGDADSAPSGGRPSGDGTADIGGGPDTELGEGGGEGAGDDCSDSADSSESASSSESSGSAD